MSNTPAFLQGGGGLGERMRALEWSATLLGKPEGWPPSLATLVRVMLSSRQPMFLAWGEKRVLLYNDAYAPMLGARDADALGRPFFDVWPEVRQEVGALMDSVFAGEPVHMDDLQLTLHRNGYPEEAHFAFSYTPVLGEDGGIEGLFSPCTETTRQVIAERTAERTKVRSRIWELSTDLIGVANADGIFERTNPAWGAVLGWSEAEIAAAPFLDFVHPDDVEPTLAAFARLEARDPVLHFENRCRAKGGAYRWLAWVAVPEDGLYYCNARDVTEEKEQAAALAVRAAERDRIWQLSRDMLGVADDRGVWLSVNPAWTVVLGWQHDEIIGRTSEWIEHPDDQTKTRAEVGSLAAGATTYQFENHFRTRNGDYRTLSWSAVPENGLLYCMARDVTGERERAAALRLFQDIVESASAPICAFDTEFRLIAFNKAHSDEFFRIYNYRVRIGDVFPDLFLPEQAPVIRGFMARALTGEVYTVIEEFGDPNIVRPYWEVSYSPIRDENRRIIGAFHYAQDISSRLRAQAELEGTQEALRQSQKMEAVGQLTGGLAHDFNNLLAGISGSLEMMQNRIQQGRIAEIDRYMVAAQGATRRAAALTHRLLAFSRRQTLDPKPTDVNSLVAEMEDLIRRTVGPQVGVEAVAKGGLWSVLVDPNQLENALLNLCINARDAMPDGGRITIETANRWLDERAAQERDLPPGQYVSMCVSDNGTGMSKDVIERAFDPFFTTKPIGLGTGLGLSMIYGFARQSEGQARIYSEVGQGTMVCIYLPRHHVEEAAEITDVLEAHVGGDNERTVLVIDDEPLVRMLIVDAVEDLGHTAIEAGDGLQGLKVLRSDVAIDLLITDVGLPNGMNGRQVADAARELRPDLKVLFVTGYAENAVLSHGHLDPGMQVVTKPFDMSVLARRIQDMVDG